MAPHTGKKGNARERRKAARAEKFGHPGATPIAHREAEAGFARQWDPARHQKADTRELERTDHEPANEGLISRGITDEPGKR
jgi:hypothetical protein